MIITLGSKTCFKMKVNLNKIHDDPTPARLSSIQRYLKRLNNRNKLEDEVFKQIRSQNAELPRAHGVPKLRRTFNCIPHFRPILDTTGRTHNSVGKYISELNSLTQNIYKAKGSFDVVNKTNQVVLMFISLMNTCLSN